MSNTVRNKDEYLEEGLLRNMEEDKIGLLDEPTTDRSTQHTTKRNGHSICRLMVFACIGFAAGFALFAFPRILCHQKRPVHPGDQVMANKLSSPEKIYIQTENMGPNEQFSTFEKRVQDPAANGIVNPNAGGTGAGVPPAEGTKPGQDPANPGQGGNPGANGGKTTDVVTVITTITSGTTTIIPSTPITSPSLPPTTNIPPSSIPSSPPPISSSKPVPPTTSTSIPEPSSSSTSSTPKPSTTQAPTESVITSGDVTTSKPVLHTQTRVVSGVGTVVVTETSWVAVKPSAAAPKDPNLQNSAGRAGANSFLALVAGALAMMVI